MKIIGNLSYELRCFGVDIDGPSGVFWDNNYAVKNSSVPTSVLSKHNDAIFTIGKGRNSNIV